MDIYEESVKLHTEKNGKLEIKSKVKIETKHDLSLAYTPGVAEISRIIAKDKTRTGKLTLKGNTVAVITDGSAILGLGNLGPEAALPVMEGKCILFKEFAGVDAFPICLDTQDQEEIIKTIKYLAPVFGGINLEDISAPKCFEIEKRLKQELDIPVVHDDQHGAAIVILAGLINSLKVRGSDKKQVRVVINGAGAAGTATAELLIKYGFEDVIVCDSQGAIYEGCEGLNSAKLELAKLTNKKQVQGKLAEIVKGADIFIGVSAANVLSKEMVRSMNERPIIFAMANPVPEISPEDAKEAGAFIVASGRSDYPNQVNNILVFPGLFRGALDNNVRQIDEAVFIRIGERLAGLVSEPSVDMILPDPLNKEVAKAVAEAVC